jgi:anti-anti-sigma regulatory factor
LHGIDVVESGLGTTVGAWGEFDVFSLPDLRRALDDACASGGPVAVDLSGVTFLDLGSSIELAVRATIQGHQLAFENPSPCVLASFEAFGLGDGPGADREKPEVFSGT